MVIRPNINKTLFKEYKKISQYQSGLKTPNKLARNFKINKRGFIAFVFIVSTFGIAFKRYFKGDFKNSNSILEEITFDNSIKESQFMFNSVLK